MDAAVEKGLRTVLANWDKMKKSHEDDAGDDADQFEASFYEWIEKLRSWFNQLEQKPATFDEALRLPDVEQITDLLPIELMLNFETELELIVEGQARIEDERYD